VANVHFTLEKIVRSGKARAGTLRTAHATVQTPVFMPVGTQATVRSMRAEDLIEIGFPMLLANTYHLLLRPGPEVFRQFGGIHNFANWPRGILTDSGGFQIFSLSDERHITEEGAAFRSYVDGKKFLLSPELSIGMQRAIGSDIMMVLDECVPSVTSKDNARRAMELTHRWALRSLAAREDSEQGLFGIVQGACFEDLRRESAQFLTNQPFDGFAIGGLAVGETKDEREQFTELVADMLPTQKPRYLMGVGTPLDLLEAVNRGVDMFDCIIPTAHAQQGVAYSHQGTIKLRRSVYKFDPGPVAPGCRCQTCNKYSRAYVHHLIKTGENLGWVLLAWHNLYFYHDLMREMREHILSDTFADYYRQKRHALELTDVEPAEAPIPKQRKTFTARGKYRIVVDDGTNGRIQHVESSEVMHPEATPNQEAEELYVEKSSLAELLASDKEIVLWDVGLGVGHNALAAIRCAEAFWLANPESKSRLKIISFENDLDPLRLGAGHVHWFPHLKHPAPHLLLRDNIWRSKHEKIMWEIEHGDFAEVLSMPLPAPNAIFFDPFSAKVDSKLWTFEHFRQLTAKLTDQPAILVTYSSSTAIRAAMLAAGFYVFTVAGTGKRREATVAINHLEWHQRRTCESPINYSRLQLLEKDWFSRWSRSTRQAPADIAEETLSDFQILVTSRWQAQNS
jgi:queuine tRNA-ribosyltransferase